MQHTAELEFNLLSRLELSRVEMTRNVSFFSLPVLYTVFGRELLRLSDDNFSFTSYSGLISQLTARQSGGVWCDIWMEGDFAVYLQFYIQDKLLDDEEVK